MSGFIYYAAGTPGAVSYEDAAQLGLHYAFSPGEAITSAVISGPDGGRGAVFCAGERKDAPGLGYSKDTQVWRKLPAAQDPGAGAPGLRAWVGMVSGHPPTPSILQRPQTLSGQSVQLEDGQSWLIPQARMFSGDEANPGWYVTLPRYTDVNDAGEFVEGGIVREYERLWGASETFAQHMAQAMSEADDDGNVTLSMQDHFANAVVAIQTNYYVGRAELAILRALSERTIDRVMFALIDWDGFMSLVDKKKVSEPLDSTAGGEGLTEDIGPRLAS